MPLARIITDSVDDSLELTIQLRARGFQVETVAPGAVPNTPADLEVRLEECPPEEVLSRASQTAQDDLWVFVAPGVLDDRVRVIRELPDETVSASTSNAPASDQAKPQAAAPVIPFLASEGAPMVAELPETNAAAEESAQKQTAVEVSSTARAEVLVFPAAPTGRGPSAESGKESDVAVYRSPASSANLRFWRIATLVGGLAIVALLVGSNLSRQPQASLVPAVSPSATVQPVPSPARVVSATRAVAPASSPAAQRVSNSVTQKVIATRPQPTVAKKALPAAPAVHAAKAVPPRPRQQSGSHRDSIIAEDTVVFYDRKPGTPGPTRTQPALKPAGRN